MSANKPQRAEPPVRSRLAVRVQPGASRNAVVGRIGEEWKLSVSAPAIQGRANAACVELLAASLGLPRGAVRILRGVSGRRKVLEIEGLAGDEIELRLSGRSGTE